MKVQSVCVAKAPGQVRGSDIEQEQQEKLPILEKLYPTIESLLNSKIALQNSNKTSGCAN